jgi:outer membrane protein assembly factor BamE (lipoprotein component of BamABCDE complex)
MSPVFRIGIALAFAVSLAACETPGTSTGASAVVKSQRTKMISASGVNAVAVGRSTKADVAAALGEALVITFDNGYEVWAYELSGERPARAAWGNPNAGSGAEFVILFAPSGIVAKTRIRPAPQPRS